MRSDKEGFLYPYINQAECINCGKCEKVCPILVDTHKNAGIVQEKPDAYAAYNKDITTRLSSSSGGIFSLLAERVLQHGGIVFGAAMRADQRSVVHIAINDTAGLDKLRGSKYLQSNLQGIYQQVQNALHANRKVLFTGTPCQVEALRAFLGRDYDNLLCMDLICHGVPSQKVWEKYVAYRETRAGATVRRTFSRYKKYGWKRFAVLFEFSNNTAYQQIFSEDLFMQAFLRNACLRPSCHACHFKKVNRVSDITVADFWGIENVLPNMDDDKGTSLVMIHSDKGAKAFESISKNICRKRVNFDKAIAGNPAMIQSAAPHKNREDFFAHLDELPFDTLVRRYAHQSYTAKQIIALALKKLGLFESLKRVYCMLLK